MDERYVFSAPELDDASQRNFLPGYKKPATLPHMIARGVDWQAVLSVSFYRRNPENIDQLQTLTGIRANSTTHEGVVSTITGAFPDAFQRPLLDSVLWRLRERFPVVKLGVNGVNPQEVAVAASFRPVPHSVPGVEDPLSYLCQDILARKLGLQHLTQRRLQDGRIGSVSLSKVLAGFSYVDDEKVSGAEDPTEIQPVYEPLLMWGAAVMLKDEFANIFDSADTNRYSYLGWTNASTFANDVRSRDVLGLAPYVPEPASVQFCARGLCLATGAEVSQSPDLMGHLGIGDIPWHRY